MTEHWHAAYAHPPGSPKCSSGYLWYLIQRTGYARRSHTALLRKQWQGEKVCMRSAQTGLSWPKYRVRVSNTWHFFRIFAIPNWPSPRMQGPRTRTTAVWTISRPVAKACCVFCKLYFPRSAISQKETMLATKRFLTTYRPNLLGYDALSLLALRSKRKMGHHHHFWDSALARAGGGATDTCLMVELVHVIVNAKSILS